MDHLATAKHLLTSSYPSIGDPKILLAGLGHVLDAIDEKFTELLKEARSKKEIPAYGDTFTGRLTAFKMHLARKHKVTAIDLMMIEEMREMQRQEQDSPMTFRRKNQFVIADENYNLKTLTPEKLKTYIARTHSLLSRL